MPAQKIAAGDYNTMDLDGFLSQSMDLQAPFTIFFKAPAQLSSAVSTSSSIFLASPNSMRLLSL